MTLLPDTCAALWITNGQAFAQAARDEIEHALNAGNRIFVSPVTAWEVGLLTAKRRLTLPEFDHRDPADRIIVATARDNSHRIVTRDTRILDCAERGFCRALAC